MMSYETWCRLALLAFPADYRRRRGAEMLTTLLDGARPGETRPSTRLLLSVLAGGWRCRLRLRPGAGALILATCSALTAAVLGGIAAAWLAWAVAAPALPSDAEVQSIARKVAGAEPSVVYRPSAPHHLYHFDSEDVRYGGRGVELVVDGRLGAYRLQRLDFDGWTVARVEEYGSIGDGERFRLVAHRADLHMTVRSDTKSVWLTIGRAEPPSILIATIAGALVCGLAGWLLNARLGRRCAGRPTFTAAVRVVGPMAILSFFPLCFYALTAFIGGYVGGGQPEAVWGPLSVLPVQILVATGVVATVALFVASLSPGAVTPSRHGVPAG